MNVQSGTITRFGAAGYGFIKSSDDGAVVFFHLSAYRGGLPRTELERLLFGTDPIGQKIFFVPGPGKKPGQVAARGWSLAKVEGDDNALRAWYKLTNREPKKNTPASVNRRLNFEEVVRNLNPQGNVFVVSHRRPRLGANA